MISSEPQVLGNWRRSLRTFGLQASLALGFSESSSLECWRRSTELLVFSLHQALDQKHNLQMRGPFIRTSCPESSDASLAILQNMLTLMIFLSETGLQKRFR